MDNPYARLFAVPAATMTSAVKVNEKFTRQTGLLIDQALGIFSGSFSRLAKSKINTASSRSKILP